MCTCMFQQYSIQGEGAGPLGSGVAPLFPAKPGWQDSTWNHNTFPGLSSL